MRRPSRGLLLSVAVHATVAVVLVLRYTPSPHDLPVVLTFEVVQLTNGAAPDTGQDRDAPEAKAAPDNAFPGHDEEVADGASVADDTGIDAVDSEELHAANSDAPESNRQHEVEAPSEQELARREADREAPEPPALASVEPAEPSTAGAEPRAQAQDPARQNKAEYPPPPEKKREPAARSPIELASTIPEAPLIATPPLAAVEADAPTESVSEADRRELTEKIEEWSGSKQVTELKPSEVSRPSRHSTVWQHKGRQYVATFEELPAEDSMHLDRVVMSVSTEQDGRQLSTRLELKRLAFSSFAQFVDRWDPQVQIHDDRIDGRFHSNTEIVVTRSQGIEPQFLGKVTTAQGVDTSYSTGYVARKDVFLGGLETRVRRIALPRHFLPFDGDAPGERERVQKLTADARITFYADGSYGWRYLKAAAPEVRRMLPDAPYYLIAADKTDLYVQGVVNGKVLVYSPHKIVIADDLIYASDPTSTRDSDDYLGLVSDGDVEVAVPEMTGPGDLRLQASIYARHRFAIRDYQRSEHATLRLYGSLTAGSLTATEPRYRTELKYDRRFEQERPPSFPMADRYEIETWDGKWTVESERRVAAQPEPAPTDEGGDDGGRPRARPVSNRP